MTSSAYFTKMKAIVDEMATIGKKVDDDELISQILPGLDSDYNPFISALSATTNRTDQPPLSLCDLYGQLLAAEARLEARKPGYTANLASKGGRGSSSSGGGGGYQGGGGGHQGGGGYQPNRPRQNQ